MQTPRTQRKHDIDETGRSGDDEGKVDDGKLVSSSGVFLYAKKRVKTLSGSINQAKAWVPFTLKF